MNRKNAAVNAGRIGIVLLAAALALAGAGCDTGDDDDTSDAADAPDVREDAPTETAAETTDAEPDVDDTVEAEAEAVDPGPCDGLTDPNCLEIQLGEATSYRRLDEYETVEIDDDDTLRTLVPLPDLVDAEITETPEAFRYQGYGTDGYTFGGYATWTNMLNGYIEVGTRRLYWDPSQLLPNSWNVRDTYLIVATPAGG